MATNSVTGPYGVIVQKRRELLAWLSKNLFVEYQIGRSLQESTKLICGRQPLKELK